MAGALSPEPIVVGEIYVRRFTIRYRFRGLFASHCKRGGSEAQSMIFLFVAYSPDEGTHSPRVGVGFRVQGLGRKESQVR